MENNKEQMNFSVVGTKSITVPTKIDSKSAGRYVKYGEDNKYPEFLWETYLGCSVLQSIVNGTADFVLGEDIISSHSALNEDNEDYIDTFTKALYDYLIFGGYFLEVIKTKGGEANQVIYQDIRNVRVNEEETMAYVSTKWGSFRSEVVEIELFDPKKKQNHYLIYAKGKITRGIYPIPMYVASLKSAIIQNEIKNFHLSSITNNFMASAIINFNNGTPADPIQKEISNKIEEKFTGSDNAGRFLLAFNDNKESAVTIERLDSDDFDERFQSLDKSSKQDLFIAWRATPALFGVNPENTGFSKTEFTEAFELYNKTVVRPIQQYLVDTFKKHLAVEIIIKPFQLEDAVVKEEQIQS